ncbi:MAG: hypothetical protein ACRDGA_04560 [Bacteroidota bacterium]
MRLREGSNVFLVPDNLTVTFTRMMEDSRCPIGATCFWGGLAYARVDIQKPGEQTTVMFLWIPGLVTTPYRSNRAEFPGYYITLLQLDPYPALDDQGQPVMYEALLAIEKIRTRKLLR